MRVLFLSSSFAPIIGGAETYGLDLVRALAAVADVHVVAPEVDGDRAFDASDAEWTTSRYDRSRARRGNSFAAFADLARGVRRFSSERARRVPPSLRAATILNRSMVGHAAAQATAFEAGEPPDVVFALSAVPSALTAAIVHARTGAPYVVCTHGAELLVWGRRPHQRALLARLLRGASRVTAVSEFTTALGADLGVTSGQEVRLSPGVDVDAFGTESRDEARARLAIDDRTPVVHTHGRMDPRKGHDVVIRALPDLVATFPGLTYVITGDGPTREDHEALARSLGVNEHVRFLGRVERAVAARWMAAADVFVMPSRQLDWNVEGFGIVAVEAAASRTPVVAGASGGIPDAVSDGVTGSLFSPESPEACRDAIGQLLSDPARARDMGKRGRERAVASFGHDTFTRRVHELLGDVAGSG